MEIGSKIWMYNTKTGEIHKERLPHQSDNIPKDYYERDNYVLIRAQDEEKALKQARNLWARHKDFKEPDLCGHEFPEKSKG